MMNNNYFNSHLQKQKEEYKQEIDRLQKAHEEQINKFCYELEKSSLSIHRYKIELDEMRLKLNLKDKDYVNLQEKNIELFEENMKLKTQASELITKYQKLFKEMQDARQYVLKMIDNLG